jgi:hypothetical protein
MLLESFNQLDWFLALVDHYQIPRREPFYPLQVGPVRVLGPSVEYYRTLLPDFRDLEAYILREAEIEYFSSIRTFRNSLLREIFESVEDTSPCPVVDQNNECSAENDSSAVIEINVDGRYYLFTADAGVAAFDDIRARGELNRVHWLDVPHHGSRRNLTSDIIGILRPETASISAEGDSKHPRKAVINCLKKHGANVYSTHRSGNLRHTFGNFPATVGYATAIPL